MTKTAVEQMGWVAGHLAQAASAISWQAAALQASAKAEGKREAWAEVADELQALGFGRTDEETGEDVEISGAECVEAVADLYGRVLAEVGAAALDAGEAPGGCSPAPEAEARTVLRAVLDALDTIAAGNSDPDAMVRIAGDALADARRALEGCGPPPKAEARPVLTADEIGALEAAVDTVSDMFDPRDEGQEGDGERIEAARRALAKLKAEGRVRPFDTCGVLVGPGAMRLVPEQPESRGEDGADSAEEAVIDPDWELARRWFGLDGCTFQYNPGEISDYCKQFRAATAADEKRSGRNP